MTTGMPGSVMGDETQNANTGATRGRWRASRVRAVGLGVEVHCAESSVLEARVRSGRLDLAFTLADEWQRRAISGL